jgi:uncharacterized protein (TIGR02246 family)
MTMSGWTRFGVVLVGVVLALSTASARQQNQKKDPDAAVRETVKEYVAARERGDSAALIELFTADADQLVSSGEWRRGREELVRGTLASSKNNAGTRTITLKTVRFPTPDVAIADGEYVIGASQSSAARNMWTSFVLIRSEGRWRISAIRNMLPAPPGS